MPKRGLIRSYAEAHQEIYGPNGIQERCDTWFAREFPEGHKTSIRPFLKECVERTDRGELFEKGTRGFLLNSIHPRAFQLLIKHGIDYTPFDAKLRKLHESSLQPELGQCFSNSYRMMEGLNREVKPEDERVVYIEGIVIGALAQPMLHAWNAFGLADTEAFDWSHYLGCEWSRYIGIPVTQEQHWDMCKIVHPRKPKLLLRMLHRECFPKIEEYLINLLSARTLTPAVQQ